MAEGPRFSQSGKSQFNGRPASYRIQVIMRETDRRPKVLLAAYACEPVKGSEPGIGWNWVRKLSQFADVWVFTRANNRAAIEAALSVDPIPNARFVYYDLPRWARIWKKGSRGVLAYYYLWQVGAYLKARRMHRKISFDLVHHITFGTYWFPAFMAFLPVPFLWGPVGGGESAPPSFWRSFSTRGKIYELLRNFGRRRGEIDPFVRATARRAVFGIATTWETEKRLQALGCSQTTILSHAAIADEEAASLRSLPPRREEPFRIFSVGRLLHWKGFHLGIRAFAQFHRSHPESEYWLIGDGPERQRLCAMARDLGVQDKVRFCGQLTRPETLRSIRECDVLLHPSLHDSSGWASIEAMAAARPVVCLDLGGLALQVDSENGFKIPARDPVQAVNDIAYALARLADNVELRLELGRTSQARVEREFNWTRKADVIQSMYRAVLLTREVALPVNTAINLDDSLAMNRVISRGISERKHNA
jgi:glycosyltransferase involved in cell wall biosynthesis